MNSTASARRFTRWFGALGRAFRRLHSPRPCVGAGSERVAAYRLLGLEPGADPRLVRQAFRQLAAAHHPDRCQHGAAAERAKVVRRFSEITAAYHAIVT